MARGRNYFAGGGGAQSLACALLCWTVLSSMVVTFVSPYTDSSDVSALNVMYTSMKSPSKLDGWKSDGGDPCGDSWKGIKCSGSKVTEISLPGYGLTGSMGYKLSELKSVTYFDMSRNNFKDSIPYQLPPNLQQIDLSDNEFNGEVPYSISEMTNLKEINLNRNKLKGQLSDMFSKLTKLTKMDLSFNSLSGDLPHSFQDLSKLSMLHLQNNKFTGSIDVLAFLPLDDLNVRNNKFTGWIPNELKAIRKIETDGNSWSTHAAPPPPPGGRVGPHAAREEEKGPSALAITGIIFGILMVLAIIITICSKRKSKHSSSYFDEEDRLSHRRPFTPLTSVELSVDLPSEPSRDFKELKSFKSNSSFKLPSFQRSASKFSKSSDLDNFNSFSNNELKNHTNIKRSTSVHAAAYPLADLQTATGNFAMGRFLGEGSIGRVYRAKYADGKALAVKKIDSSLFQGDREIEFTEITTLISMLHHPNICELVGYCSEQGHNMLLYDYYRNGSLHEFLHLSDDFSKPLTWNTRVRIALGTARAVEYLHETCSPACAHKNIKSSNILLDVELNPRLTDCGLAIFHEQRIDVDLRVGYNAPECTKPSACTLKSDIYSFGVVMLELMTGRMPFDSKKPKFEQSLVRWATPQLHDIDALGNMVDPALRGLYSPKSLSRFADVVALCVRLEPEFRPPISEVVEALVRSVERSSALSSDDSDN